MRRVAPALEWSIPLRIEGKDAPAGARFGGRAPEGCSPPSLGARGRYLATVPLATDPELEISVFTGFSFEEMLEAAGDIARATELIDAVAHPPSPRRADLAFASELPGHALLLGAQQEDVELDQGRRIVRSTHKLGGRPYFMHGDTVLDQAVEALFDAGFRQVLQLDFPGADDAAVEGDWPFADGVFHLLGREPFGPTDWRAFWEN